MIKIINGKRYNTETAIEIGEYDNGFPTSDFNFKEEKLYKTKKRGTYFLHGKGGPLTEYSQSYGDLRGAGEDIIVFTQTEAFEYAERCLNTAEVEAEFGKIVEEG